MIDRDHPLKRGAPVPTAGAAALDVLLPAGGDTAGGAYTDALHLAHPWMGSRSIRDQLNRAEITISWDRLRRLMRTMGIHAIYRKPRTTIIEQAHKIYPYLLTSLVIERPNQVLSGGCDLRPDGAGFLYLVAIVDIDSRKVLTWRLSNTLTAEFCVEALEPAPVGYGTPEIFNTDQGAQFTSAAITSVLNTAGVSINMDGKGCWMDNVFIERLWRTIKYEEIYLRAYDTVTEANTGIDRYLGLLQHQTNSPGA
jgi:putative transposase